jgi:hypothetical protein
MHGALVLRGGEVGEGLVAEGRKGRVSHPSSLCEVLRSCADGERLRVGPARTARGFAWGAWTSQVPHRNLFEPKNSDLSTVPG